MYHPTSIAEDERFTSVDASAPSRRLQPVRTPQRSQAPTAWTPSYPAGGMAVERPAPSANSAAIKSGRLSQNSLWRDSRFENTAMRLRQRQARKRRLFSFILLGLLALLTITLAAWINLHLDHPLSF